MFWCFQDKVSELPVGPQPPLFTKNLFNLLPQAPADKTPVNGSFGDVLQQVDPVYRQVRELHTWSVVSLRAPHLVCGVPQGSAPE